MIMEENKQEKKDFKLFREKSLETVESPESLNDYLRVTSAGVWLVLAAVIVVLAGVLLWGIFGRIDTTLTVAVSSSGGSCFCVVPYDDMEAVAGSDTVTVEGASYALRHGGDIPTSIVSEQTNPYLRVAGNLNIGDLVMEIPVDAALEDGIYRGTIATESLQPISLLLQ